MKIRAFWDFFGILGIIAGVNLSALAQTEEADPFNNPLPETGMWFPNDGSGTGIILEVQAGTVVGALFGADSNGDNTWLLFSGELMPGVTEEGDSHAGWTLNAPLFFTTGSACILDCPPGENPGAPVTAEAGQVEIDFSGRSTATFTVDGGLVKSIAPFYFGVLARRLNPERPLEFLPELTGTWVLVSDRDDGDFDDSQEVATVTIGEPEIMRNPSAELDEVVVEIVYPIEFVAGGSERELSCRLRRREDPQSAVPSCTMVPGFAPMSVGSVPFDDITDSRFTVFSSDDVFNVTRTDFFRLGHD
ncbi:MAG: hypothetical protein RQ847_11855 [Wenzhouxiangellaceae bacterium]|nr:hypothetical protein [Wenzhouxiangellaceae bacterium]